MVKPTNTTNEYSCWMHREDAESIMKIYSESQNKVKGLDALNFASKCGFRVYTEWCMNTGWLKHVGYKSDAFDKFIREETHYELERRGHKFNGSAFEGLDDSEYKHVRKQVLVGLVSRAIELFSEWDEVCHTMPKHDEDKRNLRASLASYIPPW